MTDIEGIYNIDISKQNMHIFTHFKLDLKIENNTIKLYFVSSEEFGYSDKWEKGDLYAYSETFTSLQDPLKLNLYETRGEKKIITEYKISIKDNSFQIITIGSKKEYIDNYIKSNEEKQLSYDAIDFRDVTQEEQKQIDFEYQSGIELIFLLMDLNNASFNSKDLLDGIKKSLEVIDKKVKFPFAEYNNYRDLTNVLGFTFGEILRKNYGWEWKFKALYNNKSIGFAIVSPDKNTALKVEEYFYENIMYRKDIKLNALIESLTDNETEKTAFSFYEPWLKK